MPTRDQKRARSAFEATEAVLQWPRKEQSDYRSLVLGLPALIHDSGLCQTVAFLSAKAKDRKYHKKVLEDICATLLGQPEDARHDRLGAAVRDAPLPRYQHLSMDALRFSEYLKRYAEAFIEAAPAPQVHAGGGGGQ